MLCGPSLLPCFFYAQQRPVSPRGAGPSPGIGCYAAGGRAPLASTPTRPGPVAVYHTNLPSTPAAQWGPPRGRCVACCWWRRGPKTADGSPLVSDSGERRVVGRGGGGVPPSGRGRSMTCHARPDLSYYTAMHPSGRGWFRGYIDMAVGGGGGARQWFPSSADIGCAVNSSVPLLCLSLSDCFLTREAPASTMRGTLTRLGYAHARLVFLHGTGRQRSLPPPPARRRRSLETHDKSTTYIRSKAALSGVGAPLRRWPFSFLSVCSLL